MHNRDQTKPRLKHMQEEHDIDREAYSASAKLHYQAMNRLELLELWYQSR